MKKLKLLIKNYFILPACLCTTIALAQTPPVNTPISSYFSYPNTAYPGHSLTFLPDLISGSHMNPLDIAVTSPSIGNYHFVCASYGNDPNGDGNVSLSIAFARKDATTGAPDITRTINIGMMLGLGESNDMCNGMLLDESLHRIYLFGSTNDQSFILCYNLYTMNLDLSFSSGGVLIFGSASAEVIDMALTASGNFVALINNNTSGSMEFNEFNSSGAGTGNGTISSSFFLCNGKRIRKSPGGHYFVAGYAQDNSNPNMHVPMIWDCTRSASFPYTYTIWANTNSSFHRPPLGTGVFLDVDFMGDGETGAIYAVAIGNIYMMLNDGGNKGIYAKYPTNVSGAMVPISSYKNTSGLPGTGIPSNMPAKNMVFTRCMIQPDGYVVVLGFDNSVSDWNAAVGYITPTGNDYQVTYIAPKPTNKVVHLSTGMNKDLSGNIIIGGCDYANSGITTIKLSSYAGSWTSIYNKTSAASGIENESQMPQMISGGVYPNPAQNTVNYTYHVFKDEKVLIQVIDLTGKVVAEINNPSSSVETVRTENINIKSLNAGIYFINYRSGAEHHTAKFIKE